MFKLPNISNIKKPILITFAVFVFLALTLGTLYHFYTPAFASFSDNYIRPLIGAQNTLAVERMFFNMTDNLNQVEYKVKKPAPPQINDIKVGETLPPSVADPSQLYSLSLAPITTLQYFPSLPFEGAWQPMSFKQFPSSLEAVTTFVRPDPQRDYAIVDIMQLDMNHVKMGLVAGTKFPGGPLGNPGPGMVPPDIQKSNNLMAAFSGGFVYSDGMSGMIVGDKTYTPLHKGLATLVLHSNGKFEIVDYEGQNLGTDVVGIRQNCPMLIQNGQVMPTTSLGESTWGWTDNESVMYTIRTGIGITKNGNLLFAVGNSLLPQTLAESLKAAGAVNAMQLDINPTWTRFVIYSPLGNGQYSYQSYDKSLVNGGYAYLHGYFKDFIYLYKS